MPWRAACLLLVLLFSLSGCEKKSQHAVVIGREHLLPTPQGQTAKDPRETSSEQWLIHIEMQNGRKASVPVERAEWERHRIGERVQARYSEGKYTGTIWGIELK